MSTLLTFYNDYKAKLSAYNIAFNTMYYDLATIAPKKSKPYRNSMLAILQGEAFSFEVKTEHLQKIQALFEETEDPILKKELQLCLRDLDQNRFLPKDFYIAFMNKIADSQDVWLNAKEKDDYTIFQPYLMSLIDMQKQALSYIPKDITDYDYLLDKYQMGMNITLYDTFFTKIKTHLLPLIQQIQEKNKIIDDQPLKQAFAIEKQAQFAQYLCSYMQMDDEKCYFTTSEHPFTEFFGPQEARFTTHYYEHDVMSSITSMTHEYGHALYSLQVKPEYNGTAMKDSIGFAMHESQSRFLENHIGKHPAFWHVNFPKLKALFPEQLNDVTYDSFMEMINVSRPTLIRVDADELTYPIHILIRYEIEKELFNGTINYDQLEQVWNQKYETYLGVCPDRAATGILQDVHWGACYFGYFPTYALGSAYAAQLYAAMERELNIEQLLTDGNFAKITDWLQTHVHQYGASKTADEILLAATGETFNSDYYINYLCHKFSQLYQL